MNIFLIMPFKSEYQDVYQAIRQSALETNHEILRLDEISSTTIVMQTMHEAIKSADLIIAEISDKNPNVMYELGYAYSNEKPVLLLVQKGDNIPFDLASTQSLIYDRFKLRDTLIKPLLKYLSHQNIRSFLKQETLAFQKKKEKAHTIFVSYSHIDLSYLNRLEVHLKPFEKEGLIDLWSDTKIKAGEKWKDKITNALDKSVIAILLISADFLASDFIVDNELPPLLKAAEENGKLILPVIVKPCRFLRHKELSQFQAINKPESPLSKMTENDREEVYVKIADQVESSLGLTI